MRSPAMPTGTAIASGAKSSPRSSVWVRSSGVARGGDGRICVVCNFRAAYGEAGKFTSKWRTWLVPAEEGVAVEVKEETDVEAR